MRREAACVQHLLTDKHLVVQGSVLEGFKGETSSSGSSKRSDQVRRRPSVDTTVIPKSPQFSAAGGLNPVHPPHLAPLDAEVTEVQLVLLQQPALESTQAAERGAVDQRVGKAAQRPACVCVGGGRGGGGEGAGAQAGSDRRERGGEPVCAAAVC